MGFIERALLKQVLRHLTADMRQRSRIVQHEYGSRGEMLRAIVRDDLVVDLAERGGLWWVIPSAARGGVPEAPSTRRPYSLGIPDTTLASSVASRFAQEVEVLAQATSSSVAFDEIVKRLDEGLSEAGVRVRLLGADTLRVSLPGLWVESFDLTVESGRWIRSELDYPDFDEDRDAGPFEPNLARAFLVVLDQVLLMVSADASGEDDYEDALSRLVTEQRYISEIVEVLEHIEATADDEHDRLRARDTLSGTSWVVERVRALRS